MWNAVKFQYDLNGCLCFYCNLSIPVVRGKIGKTSSLEINEIDENVINWHLEKTILVWPAQYSGHTYIEFLISIVYQMWMKNIGWSSILNEKLERMSLSTASHFVW